MSARDLLAAATPRPWHAHELFARGVNDANGRTVCTTEKVERGRADADLIVAAVNECEALLDIADLMRELTELPCRCDEAWTGRDLHAPGCVWNDLHEERDAIARFDALRSPELSPDNTKAVGTPEKSAPTASIEGV